MGASQANVKPLVIIDDSPWPLEEAAADAVLAEFADETTLAPRSAARGVSVERALAVVESTTGRADSRLRDMMRTLALGCLSAMALGASFAIGFGYVWSDRGSLRPPPVTAGTSVSPPRPYMPGWWLHLPQVPPVTSDAKEPKSPPAPMQPSVPRSTPPAKPSNASTARARRAGEASTTANPRPSATRAANESRATAATTAEEPARVSASNQPGVLPSQAIVSSDVASAPTREWLVSAEAYGRTPSSRNIVAAVPPHAAPVPASSRPDVDAVRHTIALYQSAYSQMDIGAMAAVWPSLDTASVERAFASVDRQALTLHECRVTTAGNLATAVCPGQVRYVGRVGRREMQERHGTWTIALERRGNAWQFVRLNVR